MEVVLAVFLAVGGAIALSGFRILREYERGVVFRLGRARKSLAGPGLVYLLPAGIDRAKVVDIRIKAIPIAPQEVITADNISILVDAVLYADVKSPKEAVLAVEEYMSATVQLASTTLRGVLGRMDLDEILANRDRINEEIRNILDQRTEQWGVEISAVELRDIVLPQEMKRAMARQAEAERERRAKVIAAQGEEQSAAALSRAAQLLATSPEALQLRLFQTLVEVSQNQNTVVMPVPIEMLKKGEGYNALASVAASSVKPGHALPDATPPPQLPPSQAAAAPVTPGEAVQQVLQTVFKKDQEG